MGVLQLKDTGRVISVLYKALLFTAVLYGLYLSIFKPEIIIENGLPALHYFTIQTNIMVALVLLYLIFKNGSERFSAIIRGGVLLYILVTGIIFHVLLVPALPEYFAEGVAFRHHITHTIAPVGFMLDWLLFDRKGRMLFSDLKYWLIYPLLYWLGSVTYGQFSGIYPYFFLAIGEIGLAAGLIWLLLMTTFFIMLGLLIIWIDRRVAAKN